MVFTKWCWQGDAVYYGQLLDLTKPEDQQVVSEGRFDPDDIDSLILNDRWDFKETTPEEVGQTRESKDCCACNDWKFPPCENCTDDVPDSLIEDLKNNNNPNDPTLTEITLELIPNPDIDRLQKVLVLWDFGDGLTEQHFGLNGQRIGYKVTHAYDVGSYTGTLTFALLDTNDEVIQSENRDFTIEVNEERPVVPLSLIVDLVQIDPPQGAPAVVELNVIGNQAFDNLVIDWDDGTITNEGRNQFPVHEYQELGVYNIKLSAESLIDGNMGSTTKTVKISDEGSGVDGSIPLIAIGGGLLALLLLAGSRKRR